MKPTDAEVTSVALLSLRKAITGASVNRIAAPVF